MTDVTASGDPALNWPSSRHRLEADPASSDPPGFVALALGDLRGTNHPSDLLRCRRSGFRAPLTPQIWPARRPVQVSASRAITLKTV